MDCSLPGSSIHGIFQARVLEWGAIAFSVWLLYCFTKLRLHKFWLQRSRALKAKRSRVRDVSEHLCWVLWNNRRPWRDAHSLETTSRAVLELTRGGTIAMLSSYYNWWFKVKAFHRNSLWKRPPPAPCPVTGALCPLIPDSKDLLVVKLFPFILRVISQNPAWPQESLAREIPTFFLQWWPHKFLKTLQTSKFWLHSSPRITSSSPYT